MSVISSKFRNDINALRAIAVIGVLIFHFMPDKLPGGYAGVDVFFVISGYLMTKIIMGSLNKNEFSFIKFFKARFTRILPALLVLILVLLTFGWFFLSPMDFRFLGKHAASSIGFISNVIYFMESGYFDADSQTKWLLHTWSLSAEWQFYILYPFLLYFTQKVFKNSVSKIILFLTISAFFITVYLSAKWPSASYFLLPTRGWEMLLGGVAFFYPIKSYNKQLAYLGLGLIVASFILLPIGINWPSFWTLIPVIGTYFIISSENYSLKLFEFRFVKKIGFWSYSIYLWHWPIVVFGNYYSIPNSWMFGIPLSILLGFLSYKFIENKIEGNWINLKIATVCFCLIVTSSLIYKTNGALFRYDDLTKQNYINFVNSSHGWHYPRPNYTYENEGLIRYIEGGKDKDLYIGDSLMEQFYASVLESTKNNELSSSSYFFTEGGCTPFINYVREDRECNKLKKSQIIC